MLNQCIEKLVSTMLNRCIEKLDHLFLPFKSFIAFFTSYTSIPRERIKMLTWFIEKHKIGTTNFFFSYIGWNAHEKKLNIKGLIKDIFVPAHYGRKQIEIFLNRLIFDTTQRY